VFLLSNWRETRPNLTVSFRLERGGQFESGFQKVVGNGDMFKLLCKASSQNEGWMKSTKAMQVTGGCVVQVTTQQKNPDGSYSLAEALTFVPDAVIVDDENNGRKLI